MDYLPRSGCVSIKRLFACTDCYVVAGGLMSRDDEGFSTVLSPHLLHGALASGGTSAACPPGTVTPAAPPPVALAGGSAARDRDESPPAAELKGYPARRYLEGLLVDYVAHANAVYELAQDMLKIVSAWVQQVMPRTWGACFLVVAPF
jgi:hypothetical protein